MSFAEPSVTPSGQASSSPGHRIVASPDAQAPDAPTTRPTVTAVASLETLRELPLAEHPDVYQRIHAELQGTLADIDDD